MSSTTPLPLPCADAGREHIGSDPDPAQPRGEPAAAADNAVATRSADELIDEYDEERPSRRLSAGLDRVLVAVCFAVSVFVLWQVFAPLQRGNQYYLILFLAAVLPLVFVCYRARVRRRRPDPASRTTRASSTGCSPRWPCWSACTRCCR